jgi:hypothetical protein
MIGIIFESFARLGGNDGCCSTTSILMRLVSLILLWPLFGG